ncbi:MAG: hypothetical protein LBD80_05815 [Tannerella sp.]|jgi:hypothetical protein|nr:hypothetical protein [Tannerella sp.]
MARNRYNRVFHIVGFDEIEDDIFKQVVVSRLCQAQSKVATVDYLKSHCGKIGLVFYDVTTLYFETDYGDSQAGFLQRW